MKSFETCALLLDAVLCMIPLFALGQQTGESLCTEQFNDIAGF